MQSPTATLVNQAPLIDLLTRAAAHNVAELQSILDDIAPEFYVDRETQLARFAARSSPTNSILIGMEATRRLQAHAYAAGVLVSALSTTGYAELSPADKAALRRPMDAFLTWAVSRDISAWVGGDTADIDLDSIFSGAGKDVPPEMISGLSQRQKTLGEGLFRLASAFILLHEVGHLHGKHTRTSGLASIEQEREADRFAARMLMESASSDQRDAESARINALLGLAVALIWIACRNIFLGRTDSDTHPEPFNRLFQLIDEFTDPLDPVEHGMVWYFIEEMLFTHMYCAGFEFEPAVFVSDPRETVSNMVELIAAKEPQL